jgi:2-keto-4-pentenoate hydratase/2-oxohepta-3-ene-1,7-dioic acid hydratase in catechol pathway
MKIITYKHNDWVSFGRVDGDSVVDLGGLAADLKTAIVQNKLGDAATTLGEVFPLSDVEFLPVIPNPGKILCIGLNYEDHRKETGRDKTKNPTVFARFSDSLLGHNQGLVLPHVSDKLDYEAELAVIIGKSGRYIAKEDAMDYVAGYSCFNDGTIRDWQRHSIQFLPGKNFPFTGGFGPWMVTAEELPDPTGLQITARLNGKVMQDANTDDLIFDIPTLINYCSSFTTLSPGDVIATGTPGGVGAKRTPPVWMKEGDEVEIEIAKVGTLKNTIVSEPSVSEP